jgi:hypothetical protein
MERELSRITPTFLTESDGGMTLSPRARGIGAIFVSARGEDV